MRCIPNPFVINFKVGTYDPFCDDPRLAIQKVYFDVTSGQLVIGGRAGHVIVYDLDDESSVRFTSRFRPYLNSCYIRSFRI